MFFIFLNLRFLNIHKKIIFVILKNRVYEYNKEYEKGKNVHHVNN